jgi:hypothetical protein
MITVITDIEDAIRLARATSTEGDTTTTRLLLGAARSNLGRIDERLRGSELKAEKIILRAADKELAVLQAIPTRRVGWTRWEREWPKRKRALLRAEPKSLYSEARLREALASRD